MIEDKIINDYKLALKNKDRQKANFLSFIRAEIQNTYIQGGKQKLAEQQIIRVLNKQKKKLRQTKEMLLAAKREKADFSEIDRELSILDQYLPSPLSEDELNTIVDKVIRESGATSIKQMGSVMKEVLSKVAGCAEPSRVSKVVKSRLS